MNGQWLIGDSASQKISKLAGHLFANFLKSAQTHPSSIKLQNYMPCIADPCFSEVPGLFINPKTVGRFVADPLFLGLLAENLNLHPMTLLSRALAGARVNIFSDISYLVPHASQIFSDAQNLLQKCGMGLPTLFEVLAVHIVPIRPTEGPVESIASLSSHTVPGAVFLCLPLESAHSKIDLAISLAHELGHQALMIYQRSDRIISSKLDEPTFSGTRQTTRPAIMAFHAAVALTYMSVCADELSKNKDLLPSERQHAQEQAQLKRADLQKTLASLTQTSQFTELGSRLFAEMKQTAEEKQ